MMNALIVLTLSFLNQAPSSQILALDASKSTIRYVVVHKLHTVEGVSHAAEGRIALLPDGKAQVMVRAAVSSFKSGDANRDEHVEEVLETSKYSHVTFKAIVEASPPVKFPSTADLNVQGELEFHGRKRPETVTLRIEWLSPTEAHVKADFKISLETYSVERPSLFFMKVDDSCAVSGDFVLKAELR
jgi:polyisoprenoid-binding protein YceI